jgi:hypothetical protein
MLIRRWRSLPSDVVEDSHVFERELRINGLMNGMLSRLLQDVDDTQLVTPIASGGNPPAWILAHLAVANDYALRMMGEPRVCSSEWHKRFGPGKSPREDNGPLPTKAELLQKLDEGRQAVASAAPKADPARMDVPQTVDFFKGTPVETNGDIVAHLMTTHMALHLGQLSAWRRVQGKAFLF